MLPRSATAMRKGCISVMRGRKKEGESHVLKGKRRPIRCPQCGRRLMDAFHTTKTRFIIPTEGQYPDFYIKCGHCGAEVGVIKTE